MDKNKIERLEAIKEEFARLQAQLIEQKKLDESVHYSRISTLLENDLEQAELMLAAQEIADKLQNMSEDIAKINAQLLFPLVDRMKGAFGPEVAHVFEVSCNDALTTAMNTVRGAKDEVVNAVLVLEGKMPANDMADFDNAGEDPNMSLGGKTAEVDGDEIDDAFDDFGGADAAAGPEEEPLGRVKKESVESTGRVLSESQLLEAEGSAILETELLEDLIEWVLQEAFVRMDESGFKSFSASVEKKAEQNPQALAGWINRRKNVAANAQLATPTFTATPDLSVVGEGKTFKKNDSDSEDKKARFKSRKQDRKAKEDELEEGKTFRKNDDETDDKKERFKSRKQDRKSKEDGLEEGKTFRKNDDSEDKKERFKSRKQERKQKVDDLDEATDLNFGKKDASDAICKEAAVTVAKMINASIASEGKGYAAKHVQDVAKMMEGGIMEGSDDLVARINTAFMESFGMSPAKYSMTQANKRGISENSAPLSSHDKKLAAGVMGKVAGAMATDKSMAGKSVQTAINKLQGQERGVANKMLNKMKKDGGQIKNVGDFTAGANSLIDETDVEEGF